VRREAAGSCIVLVLLSKLKLLLLAEVPSPRSAGVAGGCVEVKLKARCSGVGLGRGGKVKLFTLLSNRRTGETGVVVESAPPGALFLSTGVGIKG
jgi:hypothetical protein